MKINWKTNNPIQDSKILVSMGYRWPGTTPDGFMPPPGTKWFQTDGKKLTYWIGNPDDHEDVPTRSVPCVKEYIKYVHS